jgi:delta24-sterol reductase
MPITHDARVAEIGRQIVSRPPGTRITIRKATPSHSIRDQGYKRGLHAVNVEALDQILDIDAARGLARVEGQVTMGALAAATLGRGWLPAVVPEFRMFTVSGLINGEGIQSSSHRHGLFTDTLESIDIVTADGSVWTASATEHPELFAALPESLGTLGLVVAATIRLVRAKPYVRLTYRRFDTLDEYVSAFCESIGRADFHEGVIFGPRFHVVLTGEFADEAGELPILDVERNGAPYYFQHVRQLTRTGRVCHEAMPTLAYLARPERGLWWLLECHADFPLLSETTWGRVLMDKTASDLYRRVGFATQDLTPEERERCLINQDIAVRLERLAEGIQWIQHRLSVYPIWNCGIHLPENQRAAFGGSTHLVDLGIYGEPKVADYRRVAAMRALQSMGDAPSLWGMSYRSWEEMVRAFPDRYARYERARQQVGADAAFLHLRDKVVWVDPNTPDPGRIPYWRLHRTYGRRWYLNPVAHLVLAVGLASKAVWPKPTAG